MMGYLNEMAIRLKVMQMIIASGGKIKKKAICKTLYEASMAVHEMQDMKSRLNGLEKENHELRCRLAAYEDAGMKKQQVTDHEECSDR